MEAYIQNEHINICVRFIEVCTNSLRHPTFISLHMFKAQPVICLVNCTPSDLIEINIPTTCYASHDLWVAPLAKLVKVAQSSEQITGL